MQTPLERDVFCPRCRYNLRGLPEPRCPECGLTFDAEQWRTGVLREHIPTWLDRCDPWQPHQVLLRSLYELFRGAVRPWRLLTKLDLNGSLVPAGLMLVFGTLWLYVLVIVLTGAGTLVHTGASPAASLKSAALCWSPRVLCFGFAVGGVTFVCVALGMPFSIRTVRTTPRQYLRLAAYWIPAVGLLTAVPLPLLLVTPELTVLYPGLAVGLAVSLTLFPALLVTTTERIQARRERTLKWLWIGLALCFGSGAVCGWLARVLLADSLDPPLWIYP